MDKDKKRLTPEEQNAQDHALYVLEDVLDEMELDELKSIQIICDIIRRNAKKHRSKELKDLAEIIALWGKTSTDNILNKLKELEG